MDEVVGRLRLSTSFVLNAVIQFIVFPPVLYIVQVEKIACIGLYNEESYPRHYIVFMHNNCCPGSI